MLPKIGDTHWAAAVIMARTTLSGRWGGERWEVKGVVPDLTPEAPPRTIIDRPEMVQVLFSGLRIRLQRDEAEGYYMNITSPQPRLFVLWRLGEVLAEPQLLTVSYHEGARWLDSGEEVDGIPLPAELLGWIADYCHQHYKPEPPRKSRYATNRDRGRMGNWRPE